MDQRRYTAKQVANWFLERAWSAGTAINPMKLQKLVYFAHGWSLGVRDKPLIDELVQAWDYGPVVPSLYHEFKEFGAQSISRHASHYDPARGSFVIENIPPEDHEARVMLEWIWERYGKYSSWQLSNLTHEDGTPWRKAREAAAAAYGYVPRNLTIDQNDIRTHFQQLFETYRVRETVA
jgi:uncharacterized phage-associated protein